MVQVQNFEDEIAFVPEVVYFLISECLDFELDEELFEVGQAGENDVEKFSGGDAVYF